MRTVREGNYIYPKTKYVECVLSGECIGSPELLPRVEVVDVDDYLLDLGITSAYRTSYGVVYFYQKELPFYFTDGGGPDENSVRVIESFVDEGFTRVRGVAAPLHLAYVLVNSKPLYYVEIKNGEYMLTGAVKHGREVRTYVYKKVTDRYSGKVVSQELRFFPPDGDVEIKLVSEFLSAWDDFLNYVKRMRSFSNRGIIMKTLELPGIVNTSRYPPYEGYDEIVEVVDAAEVVSYDHMGPVLSSGTFVAKFVLTLGKVISYYPVRHSFDGFDVPASFIFGRTPEEEIALVVFG